MRNPLKNAIHALFHDPRHFLYAILLRMPWLIRDDEKYLSTLYKLELGVKPNLEHPTKFSEKIQWLKLHDHNPLYTTMVDKLVVKKFVSCIQDLSRDPAYTKKAVIYLFILVLQLLFVRQFLQDTAAAGS